MENITITIPASTSNLGAGFDTCGLALSLYLRLEVEQMDEGYELILSGEGADKLPVDETNLIVRTARYVADERKRRMPGARIRINSQIPLSRGLGSSSAATIAGISLYESLTGDTLEQTELFEYALHFEGHGDNIAPCMLGGLVVAVVREYADSSGAERQSLLTVKRSWPKEIKIIVCIPQIELETAKMRAVLPQMVTRNDAVYNVQRSALLQAALAEGRFDLINEALRDRLHQPYRAPLAPGLVDVLKMNDETDDFIGLLGVAISGAGSTLIALATDNCDVIGDEMVRRMAANGVKSRAWEVGVDNRGRVIDWKLETGNWKLTQG